MWARLFAHPAMRLTVAVMVKPAFIRIGQVGDERQEFRRAVIICDFGCFGMPSLPVKCMGVPVVFAVLMALRCYKRAGAVAPVTLAFGAVAA